MIISIYLIGKKLFSPAAGLLSAYFISFYPSVFGLSRKFGLDFPLIAIVCLAFYFLICYDEFKNIWHSVIFGIILGVGTLIKMQFILFIIGPLFYVVIKTAKNNQDRSKHILNFVISIIIALLICLTWCHKIFSVDGADLIYNHIFSRSILAEFKGGSFFEEIIFYLETIPFNISPIFFIVFLTGLFFYIRKLNNKGSFIIILWLLIPYLIFSLIVTKNHRYIFPIFSAVALISAIGWLKVPIKRSIKFTLILLFIVIGIYQFFVWSYYEVNHIFINSQWCHPPEKNNHQSIIKKFNEIIQSHNSEEKNIAIIEEEYFYGDFCVRLGYLLKALNSKNEIFLSAEGAFAPHISDRFLENINSYEFLIVFSEFSIEPDFSGLLTFSKESRKEFVTEIIKRFKEFRILKKGILLPERVNIFLLKRSI